MTEQQAALYSGLFQKLQLTELSIEEDGNKIILKKEANYQEIPETQKIIGETLLVRNKTDNQYEEIKAPLLGIFHRSPAPEGPAFVEEGDSVKKGDVLCVIEAMKMMNEIIAQRDGVIKSVCVQENTIVEFGQTIFQML